MSEIPTADKASPSSREGTAPSEPPFQLECFALRPDPPELVPAHPHRQWMEDFPNRHAYRCLPMAVANSYGWEILSPCEFIVDWYGKPEPDSMRFRQLDGFPHLDHLVNSNFGRGILTFHTGYMFRTPPGWNLIATGPFNRPKHGITALTGVVETDWLPYPFTMNWQMTRAGSVVFKKGDPFCMVFPVRQGQLESVVPEIRNVEDDADLNRQFIAWRESRTEFHRRLAEHDPSAMKEAWQKFYFKGEMPEEGIKAPPTHANKLRLATPLDKRK